jgi:S1-C subfamily serine protease
VPVDIVKRVVPALIADGRYRYPYMGITSSGEVTVGDLAGSGLAGAAVYHRRGIPGNPLPAGLRGATSRSPSSGRRWSQAETSSYY